MFLTKQIAKKPDCPVKNGTPGNPSCHRQCCSSNIHQLYGPATASSTTSANYAASAMPVPLILPIQLWLQPMLAMPLQLDVMLQS